MKHSTKAGRGDFFSESENSEKPYTYYINGSLTNIYQPMPKNLYPAGGTFSTATEMAQWAIALQTDKLINKESLKMLLTPITLKDGSIHEGNGLFNQNSIGFFLTKKSKDPVIATFGGARNAVLINPKNKITVVVLSNLVGARPQDFIEEIADLYITDQK